MQEVGSESTKVLDVAPPFLNGVLHVGHLYQLCNIYAYYRYNDYPSVVKILDVDWASIFNVRKTKLCATLGSDVNGLPIVKEAQRRLHEEGVMHVSPELLQKKCDEVVSSLTPKLNESFDKLGLDKLRQVKTYTTNDSHFAESLKTFERNIKEISFQETPHMYCRTCKTSLSNCETEAIGQDLKSYTFEVTQEQSQKKYRIMTTRPEFLIAIAAILYHPNDTRYEELKNKYVVLELKNFDLKIKVPVLECRRVRPDVGTGLVYISLWANSWDLDVYRQVYQSGLITREPLYNTDGDISAQYLKYTKGKEYGSLLENQQYMDNFTFDQVRKDVQIQRHTQRSECKSQISYVQKKELVLKIDPLDKVNFIDYIKKNNLIYPKSAQNHLISNINSFDSWCLSRSNSYYSPCITHKDIRCRVDTWLMSAFTFNIYNSYTNKKYSCFRFQGAQIIRTWAFYSLYINYLFQKYGLTKGSFERIFCHRHVLDEHNQKISKSKKNGPIISELLEKNNMGELRLYFCFKPFQKDFSFKHKQLQDTRKFIKKCQNLLVKLKNDELSAGKTVYSKTEVERNLKEYAIRCINNSSSQFSSGMDQGKINLGHLVHKVRSFFENEAVNFNFSSFLSYVKRVIYSISRDFPKDNSIFSETGCEVLDNSCFTTNLLVVELLLNVVFAIAKSN